MQSKALRRRRTLKSCPQTSRQNRPSPYRGSPRTTEPPHRPTTSGSSRRHRCSQRCAKTTSPMCLRSLRSMQSLPFKWRSCFAWHACASTLRVPSTSKSSEWPTHKRLHGPMRCSPCRLTAHSSGGLHCAMMFERPSPTRRGICFRCLRAFAVVAQSCSHPRDASGRIPREATKNTKSSCEG